MGKSFLTKKESKKMGFVKITKPKSYFKRFQVKFRRRRQSKTDYAARRTLIKQDLNKYDSKKYRLVVRTTNKKVICQVVYANVSGDHCMAQATSNELARWGMTAGLTSYMAAYATGLLVARRLLQKLKMDKEFKGAEELGGAVYDVSVDPKALAGDKRPFKCLLDIGLVSTTTGNRVFAALKGACDGGLHVPHSEKRFPGYRWDSDAVAPVKKGQQTSFAVGKKGQGKYDAEEHENRIFGGHVQEYYNKLKEEDPVAFKRQFSQWEKCLNAAGCEIGDLLDKVHAGILEDPAFTKKQVNKEKPKYSDARRTVVKTKAGKEYLRARKFTHEERKTLLQQKLSIIESN